MLSRIDASTLNLSERVVAHQPCIQDGEGRPDIQVRGSGCRGRRGRDHRFWPGKASEGSGRHPEGHQEDAKKNLIKIALKGTTIPHEVIGKFGAGEVLMMPAPKGTGVIAGGPVRSVMEVAGSGISGPSHCAPITPTTW